MPFAPGQVWKHPRYYEQDGTWLPKYLLVLAMSPAGDVVFRLLTSRAHGRPENPVCFHGDPYPGYYLGVLGGELSSKSWLDLRVQDDYDGIDFHSDIRSKLLSYVTTLPLAAFQAALECAAGAEDTTRAQEQSMRNQKALLGAR